MDRKKRRHFRGGHPTRYQDDAASLISSVRSNTVGKVNQSRFNSIFDRRSQAPSIKSGMSTSERLQAMSVKATGQLLPEGSATQKVSLREYLAENQMYEDVVKEINKKLALRDAIERANRAIGSGKKSAHMGHGAAEDQMSSAFNAQNDYDVRSKAPSVAPSHLSLATISQRGKFLSL